MRKAISLFLALTMCLSLCACGGNEESEVVETNQPQNTQTSESVPQQAFTADDVVGIWTLELPFKQGGKGIPSFQMDLHEGGTGEGYQKKDGEIDKSQMNLLKWEIKDDVLVISYEADPVSWTFEVSEDKTHITELTSENSFIKE